MLTQTELGEITRQVRDLVANSTEASRKTIADNLERRMDELAKDFRRPNGYSVQSGLAEVLLKSKTLIDRPPITRGMTFNIPVEAKDILNVSRSFPEPMTTIAAGPRQTLRVRDLIPSSSTSAGAIEYLRELSFTNNANVVAELAAKPKSDKTFETVVLVIQTIAHYFKVSRQTYEDLPTLAAFLEGNLVYGLDLKLEQQLLMGTGTTPELTGIYPLAVAATAPTGTPTMIDTLFLGVAELNAKGYNANGIVMNSADYTNMVLLKDTQGRYLYGSTVPLPPIIVSPFMSAGKWLIGDFRQAHLFVRQDSTIQIATQHEDDFTRNAVTALGEMRVALAVFHAAAFLRQSGVAVQESETPQPSEAQPRVRR